VFIVWGLKVFVSHTCASIAFEGFTDDAKKASENEKKYLDSASDERVSGSFLLALCWILPIRFERRGLIGRREIGTGLAMVLSIGASKVSFWEAKSKKATPDFLSLRQVKK